MDGLYSTEPSYDFVREEIRSLPNTSRVLQCVQEAGDVIYVPNMWAHLTINLQESIGLAVEFKVRITKEAPIEVPTNCRKPLFAHPCDPVPYAPTKP